MKELRDIFPLILNSHPSRSRLVLLYAVIILKFVV